MPSVSERQHNFMELIAHNPGAAREHHVPQHVAQEFVDADARKAHMREMVAREMGAAFTRHHK